MGMHDALLDNLSSLMDEGWISEVLYEVKSGKEATVFCCRAGDRPPHNEWSAPLPSLIAAKVYRPLVSRSFKNDAIYQTGRMHLARAGRVKRAAESGSAFGREVQYATWIDHEWSIMHALHHAGVDTVQPIARNEHAILMPFLGDEQEAAPKLINADVPRDRIEAVVDRLLWNVEHMLHHHCVHGDLSPYNILWWREKAVVIDLPQAIDPRLNPAGQSLLQRDIANLCDWAARHGVQRDARAIAQELWSRFVIGEIG